MERSWPSFATPRRPKYLHQTLGAPLPLDLARCLRRLLGRRIGRLCIVILFDADRLDVGAGSRCIR
jgi:hypothetical protein